MNRIKNIFKAKQHERKENPSFFLEYMFGKFVWQERRKEKSTSNEHARTVLLNQQYQLSAASQLKRSEVLLTASILLTSVR